MEKILQTITIAALLHDIGKVYQRSGKDIDFEYNKEYCPEFKGRVSHIHVAHTADFLTKFFELKDGGGDFAKKFFVVGDTELNITNLSSYHHAPNNKYNWIIAAGDRLASGFERSSFDNYNTEDWELKQQRDYRRSRLLSIFSQISLRNRYSEKKKFYYPLRPLAHDIVPEPLREISREDAKEDYTKLISELEKEFKEFLNFAERTNFDDFLNALMSLLEKYLWCVPSSSYNTLADVSLYDHLKTTAAISNALFVYHYKKTGGGFSVEEIKDFDSDEKKFLLVKGDFSGIQNFIFSRFGESNKYAAKILRAKSLYVSVFTEMVAHLLCKEFYVNSVNTVISAGGHFLTLLPNIEGGDKKIEDFFKEISLHLERLTYGQTRFNYAYEPISGSDFSSRRIAGKMDELNHKLMINKVRLKPQIYIFKDYLRIVQEAGGVCKIDGYSPKASGLNFSPFSIQMKTLGERLPRNSFLIIHFKKPEGREELIPLIEDKIYFTLKNKPELSDSTLNFKIGESSGIASKRIANFVPVFSPEDLESTRYTEIPEKVFDQTDFEIGKIKSFYHIAADSKKEVESEDGRRTYYTGKSFLGVLKADVDNLGLIFSRGLERERVSFSKIVSLSRMLDFFFTGWLPYLLETKYTSIYTVFAGGDDLFLIGAYNQIFKLAEEISNHFKEYVKNDEIHFSAGIVLKKPQVPVYQMAEDAEEKLDEAKGKGKNRLAVFDCVVRWDEFSELLKLYKDFFTKKMDRDREDRGRKNMSASFVYRLLKFIEMKDSIEGKRCITIEDIENAKWIALLKYSIYRNFKEDEREEMATKIKNLIDKYGKNLLIPISLTLYERRN